MTVKELSEMTGKSRTLIYKLAKRLGRLPTVGEINTRRNEGRPQKYK